MLTGNTTWNTARCSPRVPTVSGRNPGLRAERGLLEGETAEMMTPELSCQLKERRLRNQMELKSS